MAIYIPLKEALEVCNRIIELNSKRETQTGKKFKMNYKRLKYIIESIAEQYGKYISENNDVMFAPQIMPESSDPKCSTRYRCYIINEKIPTDSKYRVEFPDDPSTSNSTIFRVLEYSNEFSEKSYTAENGVVLKEADGSYSWWFDDMSKGEQLC